MQKKPKLLYLAYVTENSYGGVIEKIDNQISDLESFFFVELILLTNKENSNKYLEWLPKAEILTISNNLFRDEFLKFSLFKKIESKYDCIYFREIRYSPFMANYLKKITSVMEINGDSRYESRWLKAAIKKYFKRNLLKYLDGLVVVSKKEVSTFHGKVAVIPNGYNLKKINSCVRHAPIQKALHVFFIASNNHSWQGIDQVIKFAKLSPDITFDIVGDIKINRVPHNVKLHGSMSYEQYKPILLNADCAMSTMALFRSNESRCSSLKFCEYIAHGIPVILNYKEESLDNMKYEFILELENCEGVLNKNKEKVVNFIKKSKNTNIPYEYRKQVSSTLMNKKRASFILELLN